MRGRTCSGLIFLLLLSAQARAETACVDFALLKYSTVSITRYFDDAERAAHAHLAGIRGTGWFQSPTTIVTIEHVATAMGLSIQDWKPLDIKGGADSQFISARIQRWVGGGTEKLAVLELQTAISAARSVEIRMAPLVAEDRVVTLAYPDQSPRFVSGRFGNMRPTAGSQAQPSSKCMRAIIVCHRPRRFRSTGVRLRGSGRRRHQHRDHTNSLTPFGARRISTAWGSPNVVSVPVRTLMDEAE